MALYTPAMGYYVAGQRRFGADGDFVTAPELGDVFGRCLARQVAEVFTAVDENCDVLEFGAGSGRLAVSLINELESLDALPERYLILETSPDSLEEAIGALGLEYSGPLKAQYGDEELALAEVVVQETPVPMRLLGFEGFCPTGSPAFLFEQAGLTPEGIASAAREVIG